MRPTEKFLQRDLKYKHCISLYCCVVVKMICTYSGAVTGIYVYVMAIQVGFSNGYCKLGWTFRNKRCYTAIPQSSKPGYGSVNKAEEYCREQGGTLMNLHTKELGTLAKELVEQLGVQRGFIGLNDKEKEGDFRWSDGTKVIFSNWRSGEPSNSRNENCVQMQMLHGGTWNDIPCAVLVDVSYAILCEKEESPDHVVLTVTPGQECGNR